MPKEPVSVFLDANVWFAAARSKTGGSFYILELAKAGLIKIYTNQHALDEAERNLLSKSHMHVAIYQDFHCQDLLGRANLDNYT